MSDEQSGPEQIEVLRLEVEQFRAEIERLRHLDESYRTFLQGWQVQVVPIHNEQEHSRKLGASYAQAGIKSMFILNGGALVALPAFVKMTSVDLAMATTLFADSVVSFVTGLVLITATTLFAYMSLDADAVGKSHLGNVVRFDLIKRRNPDEFTEAQEEERQENDTNQKKYRGIAQGLARAALGFAIASLVACIVGAGIGIYILTKTPHSGVAG